MKAVQELKNNVPKQVGDIRKLLGLFGYYRGYIPNFAQRAKPLFKLLQRHDEDLNEHEGKGQKGKSQGQVSSRRPILQKQEHPTALKDLIDCLTSPPILRHFHNLTSPMCHIQMHPRMAWVPSFTNDKKVTCVLLHMHQER